MTSWLSFALDERAAVEHVLASSRVNYWNGEEGRAFEREFAAYLGMPHAVAVPSSARCRGGSHGAGPMLPR